ncbi:NAD(P)-binding protein [Gautieria morchelliformis]|nr:NAD(P)-binding protein [Gautieria morchelliformis]
MTHKLLVVGGNGFVGSTVCRAALGRGWEVASISSSGTPFRTPKGHKPGWAAHVSWHTASALSPNTYRTLLRGRTAVVHTVGTLLEIARYKEAVRATDVGGLARAVGGVLAGGEGRNPLKRGASTRHPASYETINRDTALRVCETYLSAIKEAPDAFPRDAEHMPYVFVYLSAEDMGRPVIPRRYIETKRAAEHGIEERCEGTDVRGVYIRPSFIYHPHLRPFTTPIAALASLSATLHSHAPSLLPTPSRVLHALARAQSPDPRSPSPAPSHTNTPLPSALHALATTLELPPIHVDHVAEAVCRAIERQDVRGPVGLRRMRELIGWGERERGG